MKSVYTLLIGFMCAYNLVAYQTNDIVVAQIDELEIRSNEFLYAFKKNRSTTDDVNADTLRAYVDNYINFKLKVLEARKQGLDTLTAFKEELAGYLSQIKKPYLENPKAEEELIKETHRRMQIEINASHLLIKVKPNASPEDTLEAYQFIDSLKSLIKSREEFEDQARKHSQDGSAANGGQLGWFSAMDMVGLFETAAYKTNSKEVSEIVKTQFGYHILFVNESRPSRGKLKTSHIFFSTQERTNQEAKTLATSIYDSLNSGANWNLMARKYSDDARTRMNGGQLPWARIKQLPDDFFDYAYALKSNDISAPSQTRFGWHIIRLDAEEPVKELAELRPDIEQRLKSSRMNQLNNGELIKKLKIENGFSQNQDLLTVYLTAISNQEVSNKILKSKIFTLGQKSFLVNDFTNTLPSQNISLNSDIVNSLYLDFEKKMIIAYEDSIAPTKYPEYGFLRKEYEEGLLLFEIMQDKIWGKAISDSVGTKAFYLKNKRNYTATERLSVNVLTSTDESIINKLVNNKTKNRSVDHLIKSSLTEKERALLKNVKRIIKASEIPNFEATELKSGSWVESKGAKELYFIEKVIPAGSLPFEEIKGRVLSDYQDHLDQKWVKKLRRSYKVKVNNKSIEKLAKIED